MTGATLLSRLSELLPAQPDPRAHQYPLMQSWTPTALISLAYVFGVCAWRAELKKRCKGQPKAKTDDHSLKAAQTAAGWDLVKGLIILYNVVMVFYSSYLVISSVYHVRKLGYGLGCVEIPHPADKRTDMLVFLGYLFYFSKFVEMLDTVFFLWRGKVDQVTFLHVFHHAAMPPSIWWGMKYAPGGIVYTFLVANSFIHVIMYTYYGLAAAGLYKYLWWKNYLTIAQMVQFVFLILHQGQIFVSSTPCNYPKIFPAAIIFYATVFLILFGNFYIQAYWRKQRLVKRHHRTRVSKANGIKSNGYVAENGSSSNGHVVGQVRERKIHG